MTPAIRIIRFRCVTRRTVAIIGIPAYGKHGFREKMPLHAFRTEIVPAVRQKWGAQIAMAYTSRIALLDDAGRPAITATELVLDEYRIASPGGTTAQFLRDDGAWAAPSVIQPWQFQPETYGARGDAKVIGDATISSDLLTTLSSASAGFTWADTGKTIIINGANGTAAPLITTITYASPTTVTLAAGAGQPVTDTAAIYGTDDTAAINTAVSAAAAYALEHQYYAEVVFRDRFYMLASGPTQTTSPAVQNAQIPLPYPAVNGTTQKLVIALTGAGDAGQAQFWESTTPDLQGTCLVSAITAPSSVSGTYGYQSVIGGPSGGGAFTGGFANTKAVFKGITVVCPAFTNSTAYDLGFISAAHVDACSAQVFAPANAGVHPYLSDLPPLTSFQSTISRGARFPLIQNNDDVTVPSFTVEGYETGVLAQDHLTAGRICTIYCDLGVLVDFSDSASNISHDVTIQSWSCEQVNGGIRSNGSGGSVCRLRIVMDSETASPSYDVSDNGNTFYGLVQWGDPNRAAPAVTGAANLRVINDRLSPGIWSAAPAAPASGTPQQNTAWRDATVYLSATSGITAVSVDSTALGLTAGNNTVLPVTVPSGHTYTVTYSGTLTTQWLLC